MAVAHPPPLPDIPLARLAPSATLAPVASTREVVAPSAPFAPVGWGAKFFLHLPLPTTVVAMAFMLVKAHRSGLAFRHETSHGFVRIFDAIVFGGVAGAALLTGVVVLLWTFRRLSARAQRVAIVLTLTSAAVAGASLWGAEGAFRAGKLRAYADVNAALLAADCQTLGAAFAAATPADNGSGRTFIGNDRAIPAYVRSLRPKYVFVNKDRVDVIMAVAPISGANGEGFHVPLKPLDVPVTHYAATRGHVVVSAAPPVFRYGW